jgi:hypothetical protein
MFEFLFGGKRKLELIRELLEQRMREAGFDDLESRLKVKELNNTLLSGTPEAAIVTIVETTLKMQKQGILLFNILSAMENHRGSLGRNADTFNEILQVSRGPDAGYAVPMYIHYRVNLEAPGRMSADQIERAIAQCIQVFS